MDTDTARRTAVRSTGMSPTPGCVRRAGETECPLGPCPGPLWPETGQMQEQILILSTASDPQHWSTWAGFPEEVAWGPGFRLCHGEG